MWRYHQTFFALPLKKHCSRNKYQEYKFLYKIMFEMTRKVELQFRNISASYLDSLAFRFLKIRSVLYFLHSNYVRNSGIVQLQEKSLLQCFICVAYRSSPSYFCSKPTSFGRF